MMEYVSYTIFPKKTQLKYVLNMQYHTPQSSSNSITPLLTLWLHVTSGHSVKFSLTGGSTGHNLGQGKVNLDLAHGPGQEAGSNLLICAAATCSQSLCRLLWIQMCQ